MESAVFRKEEPLVRYAPASVSPRMLDREQLADAIRRRRSDLGWTKRKLADQVGRTEGMIGRVERGERGVSIETLDRILTKLGLDFQLVDTGRPRPAEGETPDP